MNLLNIIEEQRKLNAIFSMRFIKKDGTERKITCRFNVKKHLHGGKTTIDEEKYFIVYDLVNKGYRAVNKETIFEVKAQGKVYN